MRYDAEFALILNHSVRVGRRSGFTKTAMGDRRPTGETTVVDALSCFFQPRTKHNRTTGSGYHWTEQGQMVKIEGDLMAQYDVDLQPGDLLYPLAGIVGFTFARVLEVRPIMDLDGQTHHLEAIITKQA